MMKLSCAAIAVVLMFARGDVGAQAQRLHSTLRALPHETTELILEAPSPARLWELRAKVAQLGVFAQPRPAAWLEQQLPRAKMSSKLREILLGFDRGLAMVTVHVPEQGSFDVAIGAASAAARLRGLDVRLRRALDGDQKDSVVPTAKALPDSPLFGVSFVPARVLEASKNLGSTGAVHLMHKGRLAAVTTSAFYHAASSDEQPEHFSPSITALGRTLGVHKDGKLLELLPGVPKLADGNEVLGRMTWRSERLRSKQLRSKQGAVSTKKPASAADQQPTPGSLDGVMGAQSTLFVDAKGNVRERLALLGDEATRDGLFGVLRVGKRALGDCLASVSASAIGVARFELDGAKFEALLRKEFGGQKSFGSDIDNLLVCLGIDGKGAAGLREVGEIVIALMPPAAGSPIPEPVLLSRVPAHAKQHENFLGAVGKAVAKFCDRAWVKNFRKLGKGDDAVRYISLRDILKQPATGRSWFNFGELLKVFGGGFVSTTRIGPYFAVGLNPRTLRRFARDVRGQTTLAGRESLRSRFPPRDKLAEAQAADADTERVFEGWMDGKAVANELRIAQLAALLAVFRSLDSTNVRQQKAPTPQVPDVLPLLGETSVIATRAPYGLRFDYEGATLLSPFCWTSFVQIANHVTRASKL